MKKTTKLLHLLFLILLFLSANVYANEDRVVSKSPETALNVDTEKSSVTWTASKVGGDHTGAIKLEKGNLTTNDGKLTGGTFVMNMESMNNTDISNASMNEKLVGHLKSDDFFSVEKHPYSEFKITKAERVANVKEGNANYKITGDLTIKGITHSITFPATVSVKGNNARALAKIEVDRTKWDIKYRSGLIGTAADKIIHDNFIIEIDIVAGTAVASK